MPVERSLQLLKFYIEEDYLAVLNGFASICHSSTPPSLLERQLVTFGAFRLQQELALATKAAFLLKLKEKGKVLKTFMKLCEFVDRQTDFFIDQARSAEEHLYWCIVQRSGRIDFDTVEELLPNRPDSNDNTEDVVSDFLDISKTHSVASKPAHLHSYFILINILKRAKLYRLAEMWSNQEIEEAQKCQKNGKNSCLRTQLWSLGLEEVETIILNTRESR